MATSRTALILFLGSMTWPPFKRRSYFCCAEICVAQERAVNITINAHILIEDFMVRDRISDIQSFQKGDGFFSHFHVLFDEVILDSAGLRRRKNFFPVDRAFSYRHNCLFSSVPILEVHRGKTSWIFHEVFSG